MSQSLSISVSQSVIVSVSLYLVSQCLKIQLSQNFRIKIRVLTPVCCLVLVQISKVSLSKCDDYCLVVKVSIPKHIRNVNGGKLESKVQQKTTLP